MKLLAGTVLFLLCALAGEGRARCLRRRERLLSTIYELISDIGDRQQRALISFREGALLCPSSPERDQLLNMAAGVTVCLPSMTTEEKAKLAAYARSDSRSVSILRTERDALLCMLQQSRDRTREELAGKGQVYRSVGYLCGVAALLLVL